ncbi:MAG: zinc ribbon domain-containing protein [Promethearchaeota archaeon]
MNIICPGCNQSISADSKYCSYCGYEITQPIALENAPKIRYDDKNQKIMVLKNKIDEYTTWGIISIFLFWPLAIYFFIKRSEFKNELFFLSK